MNVHCIYERLYGSYETTEVDGVHVEFSSHS
jgi:hypothetical protein